MSACRNQGILHGLKFLSCAIATFSAFSNEDMYLLSSDNFINIKNNLRGRYRLVENIDLNGKEWIPVGNQTHPFSGRLKGNGYVIGNATAALFLHTDGAEFEDIIFVDLNIKGNPAAPLVITGKNTHVNGIKVSGGAITGYNGAHASYAEGGDGHNGTAASGVMHRGENVTVSDVVINLHLKSGNGGHGGGSNNDRGGNGGAVSGVMHTGIDSTISNVQVFAHLQSGNGGQGGAYGNSGDGGIVSGVLHTGTNSKISNVTIAGTQISGYGGTGSRYTTNGNGGDGGEVSGVIHTGTNSVVENALVIASINGGTAGDARYCPNGISASCSGVSHGDGGNGGNISGVMHTGSNSTLENVLVTSPMTVGIGGQGGINSGRNGDPGMAFALINSGTDNKFFNTLYNTNTTGVPGGHTTAELKTPSTYSEGFEDWRIVPGKYPFPEALDVLYFQARVNETEPLDCGDYACPPEPLPPATVDTPGTATEDITSSGSNCLFTHQSSGALKYLLYDGQHFHGVVKSDNDLTYWVAYENHRRVSLEPCDVYDFTNLFPTGIVADAAVYHNNRIYMAYHPPDPAGQTPPVNSMLAMFYLLEGQPQLASNSELGYPVTSLSVDGNDVLINTGQVVYRLSRDNNPLLDVDGSHALRPGEIIQAVTGDSGNLYLLTHEMETGYRIRVLPESDIATFVTVTTSSGITTGKQVIAALTVSENRLHLLLIDSSSVIWRKYSLEARANTLDQVESESNAPLPRNITPAAIALIPERDVDKGTVQDQVFIMGNNPDGQPQYLRLTASDFTSSPNSSPDTERGNSISNWPWWAKTVFGTSVTVTGMTALTTASCLIRKAWKYYKYPDGKPDFMKKVYQQLKKQDQPGTRRYPSQLPLPGPGPSVVFGPGGGSMAMAEVVPPHSAFTMTDQNLPPMETLPIAQAYEEVHIYETIDPEAGAETGHPQSMPARAYEKPVSTRRQKQTGAEYSGAGQTEAGGNQSEQITIHQQPEHTPDDLDGFDLTAVSEEPWYANTNPGVIASAPVYTELNKPSAKRALQCMEAQQTQQAGTGQPEPGSLDCAGPGQSPVYFHALVQLQGRNPFSPLGRARLKALAKGFDLVFKGMEAVDSYVYDFPPGHPKRTRVHTQHVAEILYGEHLTTTELFDRRIGDMEDPIIGFCNAMGANIWHAFLLFRNSRNGEYNTLHIRQGSYYPEFMDKAATERYFHFEQKRIVGAISLTRLTQSYGARLDLNLLRDIFRQRLGSKDMPYRISNQNCMTFSMLAFWATNFDWLTFLQKMGLANLQSPYHILKALEGSPKNSPAIHSQENNLLPDWLGELNQGDE